jgi:hypothetical protein
MFKKDEERSIERQSPSPPPIITTPTPPLPPGVRKEVIDTLIKQVVNDPVVNLKYQYWGGNSPHDLAEYFWIKYRKTEWKLSKEEAQVLKSKVLKILDRMHKEKAEKKV